MRIRCIAHTRHSFPFVLGPQIGGHLCRKILMVLSASIIFTLGVVHLVPTAILADKLITFPRGVGASNISISISSVFRRWIPDCGCIVIGRIFGESVRSDPD